MVNKIEQEKHDSCCVFDVEFQQINNATYIVLPFTKLLMRIKCYQVLSVICQHLALSIGFYKQNYSHPEHTIQSGPSMEFASI